MCYVSSVCCSLYLLDVVVYSGVFPTTEFPSLGESFLASSCPVQATGCAVVVLCTL